MKRYRTKPVVVEAVQWTGDNDSAVKVLDPGGGWRVARSLLGNQPRLNIHTLEGTMCANVGDWIIRGVQGELYPCKPDVFAETYEEAYVGDKELAARGKLTRELHDELEAHLKETP